MLVLEQHRGEGGQHGTRRLKRTEREVGGIADGGEKMDEHLIVPPIPRQNLGDEYASREEEAWGGNGGPLVVEGRNLNRSLPVAVVSGAARTSYPFPLVEWILDE